MKEHTGSDIIPTKQVLNNLLIRVDANTQIGTGHFMRCLAIAQAWKDSGGQVSFITTCTSKGLLDCLHEDDFEVHLLTNPYPAYNDLESVQRIVSDQPHTWVVLDGYHFDEAYHRLIKDSGHRLLVIDDMAHLEHYYADILLNQNLHADKLCYSMEAYTRLLLGTKYVLLRREFLTWKEWKRNIPEIAQHVLVTLGGSDSKNYTLKIIQALQQVKVPALEVTVVVGASNPNMDVLKAATKKSRIPIYLIRNASNMPELMAWADIAISSAGTTIWELLFFKMPILALISADNQDSVAKDIEMLDIGKNLGCAKTISVKELARAIDSILMDCRLRANMSENASWMVDGGGAQRAINAMQEARITTLTLRPAKSEDCPLLWEWVNEPAVRSSAFNSSPISWDEHLSWYHKKLKDPNCFIYIVMDDRSMPIGQLRLDIISEGIAEVDVSISTKERNKGYASSALKLLCQSLLQEVNVGKALAHVKIENKASISAFSKAGFISEGIQDFNGHRCVEMVFQVKRS